MATAAANRKSVEEEIRRQLVGTPYESKSLTQLSGGIANFVYRIALAKPLEDGTAEVVLKHGEEYAALSPNFKLQKLRCVCISHPPEALEKNKTYKARC